jgi:nitroreductase
MIAGDRPEQAGIFGHIVATRRSVRKFSEEMIPEEVVRQCLSWGMLAPNSSNLQTWMFHWVRRDSPVHAALAHACLDQNAAKTASDIIFVTVRPRRWKEHARWNVEQHPLQPVPKIVRTYYEKLAWLMYSTGPWGLLAPFKWLYITAMGLKRPVIREPLTPMGLRQWAVKSAALACENIMLGFRAHGYDTCPMEGYDKKLVRLALQLRREEYIVMGIAAGRRGERGVYHDQYRLPEDALIRRH